ncbi:MAG: rhodanese-like domain-containing protein [Desulfohalobiaceae bacterium]
MWKRLRIIASTGLIVLLMLVFAAGCAQKDTGTDMGHEPGEPVPTVEKETDVPNPYHTFVPTEFVKSIVSDNLLLEESPDDVLLIDARPKRARYDRGHIPTAVNLPNSDFEERAEEVLPEDKSTLLVFYCMSPG